MPDTSSSRRGYVVMLTCGEWTLNDVQDFVQAFDRMYGTLLTVRLATARVHSRSASGWSHPSLSDYVLSPAFREPPDTEQWSPQPLHRPTRALPIDLPFGPEIRYLQFLFEHRYTFVPEARPSVYSWRMASPGRISISGVADVMREIREFIKDVKYRNRQEEALGTLEIARKHIELEQSILSPPATDYMAAQLLTEYKQIELLEERNKLLPPTSYEAHYERFIRRLETSAASVVELKPVLRRAAGLANPKARGWEKRWKRIQSDLRELFHADKLEDDPYNALNNSLRALMKARQPGA